MQRHVPPGSHVTIPDPSLCSAHIRLQYTIFVHGIRCRGRDGNHWFASSEMLSCCVLPVSSWAWALPCSCRRRRIQTRGPLSRRGSGYISNAFVVFSCILGLRSRSLQNCPTVPFSVHFDSWRTLPPMIDPFVRKQNEHYTYMRGRQKLKCTRMKWGINV